jgi:hypothetical protein
MLDPTSRRPSAKLAAFFVLGTMASFAISGCSSNDAGQGSGGAPVATGGDHATGGAPATGGMGSGTGGAAPTGGGGGTHPATGGSSSGGSSSGGSTGGATGGRATGGGAGSPDGPRDGGSSDNDASPMDGGPSADNPPPALTGTTTTATVKVTRGNAIGKLPAGSAGFSFEKSHMSDGFFTPSHESLIAMFKLLGPGVVRIGADDVNNSVWVPSATFVKPGTTSPNVGTAEVDALAEFLTATGWKAIYAVNMRGSSTPETAVTELTYVIPKLGASLQAVEIGNELNLYPASPNAQTVWHGIAQAIRKAFPTTLIAGPGDFEDVNYCTKFVSGEASLIDIITHHYYRGQAGTSVATLANLVNTDSAVTSGSQSLANSARTNNIKGGFRFGETNTYSSHGQQGMSDALVSALWGVNFLLTTAQYGSVGTNFHGGGQNMDGNNCPNGVSSCDKPFRYSPLIEVDSKVTAAAPLYYGMLLVSQIGAGDMLSTTTTAGSTKLHAYTVTPADGTTKVILVNMEATTGVNATVDVGAAVASATAVYLRGPSLTSTTGVTLGEAPVTAAGAWSPKPAYTLTRSGMTFTVPVPAASAVLVTVR